MLKSLILAIFKANMATLLEQAGNAAGQWVRQEICQNTGNLLDNLPAIGKSGRAAREIARGIHGGLCGLPTPPELGEPTPSPPPFTGGQCAGVIYYLTIAQFDPTNGITRSDNYGPYTGPMGNLNFAYEWNQQFSRWQYAWDRPNGTRNAIPLGGNQADGPFAPLNVKIMEKSVFRLDGQPDDCGDLPPGDPIPPPAPPDPLPPPPDIDLPVTPPGGGPDIDLTFSPRIGPVFIGVGGALFIPVNVRISGPSISVDAPISIPIHLSLPDLNINFPGQGDGGGEPDDPEAPVPPGPPPRPTPGPPQEVCCDQPATPGPEVEVEDDEPVEPVSPGRRFIGIRVSCTVNQEEGSFTVVGQGGGERNLYLPRLANVYFDVRVNNLAGAARPATVGPLPVQLLQQYFPAPESVASVNWRIVREPGVSVSVIPLFVPANRT